MSPLNFKDVDVSKIKLAKSKDGGSTKGWSTGILYNGNTLQVQTPKMSVTHPVAATQIEPKKRGDPLLPPIAGITLTLDKSDPDIEAFGEFIEKVHTKLREEMKANSVSNFGEEEDFKKMRPLVKQPNTDYPPTFFAKMEFEDDKASATNFSITTPVYDPKGNELKAEDALKRKTQVVAVIEFPYIHSAKPSLASTIRVNADRVCVLSTAAKKAEFSFNLDPSWSENTSEESDNKRKADDGVVQEGKKLKTVDNFDNDNDDI
jgi:hypothetical protein